MSITMYWADWQELWAEQILERWQSWRPSKTDCKDFFARFKNCSKQDISQAAQKLKISGAKKPTMEGISRFLPKAKAIEQAAKRIDGNAAKRIVYLGYIKSGQVPQMVEQMPLYCEVAVAIEELIEERIAIVTDGRTDTQLLSDYRQAGLHPAHAKNKLDKLRRCIREQVIDSEIQHLTERLDNAKM